MMNPESSSPDYNIVIKIVIILMLVTSIPQIIGHLISYCGHGYYGTGIFDFLGSSFMCYCIFQVYRKKKWGLIGFFSMLIFSVVSNLVLVPAEIREAPSYIVVSPLFRGVLVSLFLFLRKDGMSGWKLLFHNGNHTLSKE